MLKLKGLYGTAIPLFIGLSACWLFVVFLSQPHQATADVLSKTYSVSETAVSPQTASAISNLNILVDDFHPQPIQGDDAYFYNRLGGDRGALGEAVLNYGQDSVTARITGTWGGMWTSLNHLQREGLPTDLSALLPDVISDSHQVQVTELVIEIADSRVTSLNGSLKLELKNGDTVTNWVTNTKLTGNPQILTYTLPSMTDTTTLIWLLDQVNPNDFVEIDRISLTAVTPITNIAEQAFTWSYGMLLNNWDPNSGLVRDRANFPGGVFDAVQATGSLAAATAVAHQLDLVNYQDAANIVTQISNTLLLDVPRYKGIWPHFVEIITPTNSITIAVDTEWSSIDTVIAAVGLLEAQTALNLDTSGTISMLQNIDWDTLVLTNGISHGYSYTQSLLTSTWDTFGGESWLAGWAYAAAAGKIAPLKYPVPPTANGSGFIDELSLLFAPPLPKCDVWGAHWLSYRPSAVSKQVSYYPHYPEQNLASCFTQLDLFGLSAAEIPTPSDVTPTDKIYQPFGVGGQFSPALDGSDLFTVPVVIPHYSAMAASITPTAAISMWTWLIDEGPFSPLNNVESLMFPADAPSCNADEMEWNELKGSWNLALQTLGWGRYLAQQRGETPILWQAMRDNQFLADGYALIGNDCLNFLPVVTNE